MDKTQDDREPNPNVCRCEQCGKFRCKAEMEYHPMYGPSCLPSFGCKKGQKLSYWLKCKRCGDTFENDAPCPSLCEECKAEDAYMYERIENMRSCADCEPQEEDDDDS